MDFVAERVQEVTASSMLDTNNKHRKNSQLVYSTLFNFRFFFCLSSLISRANCSIRPVIDKAKSKNSFLIEIAVQLWSVIKLLFHFQPGCSNVIAEKQKKNKTH